MCGPKGHGLLAVLVKIEYRFHNLLKELCHKDCADYQCNCSKISGMQLYPLKNIISENLKEDITLIYIILDITLTTAINIDFLKTLGNSLKSLAKLFKL